MAKTNVQNPKDELGKEGKECDTTRNKNFRSKGKKPSDRSKYRGKSSNDISWHAKSNQLLADCANVPWSYSTGRPLRRAHLGETTKMGNAYMTVPGIFAIKTVLTPGVSTNPSDAINIAAQALYTDIRSQLKSANAYDSSDVMIYMCEMAEIKAAIAFIRRILGTPLNFSFMNAFFPDDLLKAQGINPVGIHEHYADYRSRANQLIAKASQIWWPKGFDYITRAEWEYGNYYSEGESIKDQIYMFTPGLFRKFTYDEDRDYAGMLQPCIKFDYSNLHTMDELLAALSDMIDSVVGDSDFQNIAGDLFNRYGAGGVETFSLIPDTYILNPSLSFEVLEQMQNSKCLTFINDNFNYFTVGNANDMFDIAQDPVNNILRVGNTYNIDAYDVGTVRRMYCDLYDPIFTVDKDPDPTKTMLITRCSNVITECTITEADDHTTFNITYDAAMELVVGYEYYWRTDTGNLTRLAITNSFSLNFSQASLISAFHYHPLKQQYTVADGVTTPYPMLCGSIDTYSTISPVQLKDMNRVDLMSLFAVPNVGTVNK